MTDELEAVFEVEESTTETTEDGKGEEAEASTEETTEEAEAEIAETDEVVTESEPPADNTVPKAAMLDWRRKAQEAQAEVKNLRKQLPKSDGEPDIYEDPDAWKQWQKDQMEQTHLQETQAELAVRIEDSRSKALEEIPDFITAENAFMVRQQSEPDLAQQMLSHPDPAKFAYEKGMEFIDGLRGTTQETTQETKSAAPSLATATAQGSNSTQKESMVDLDDLFADQNY